MLYVIFTIACKELICTAKLLMACVNEGVGRVSVECKCKQGNLSFFLCLRGILLASYSLHHLFYTYFYYKLES